MYLNEKTLRFKSTQSKNAVMSHGSNGKKAILYDNNLYTITMQTLCTKWIGTTPANEGVFINAIAACGMKTKLWLFTDTTSVNFTQHVISARM